MSFDYYLFIYFYTKNRIENGDFNVKRFKYYKPYVSLFVLDIAAAIIFSRYLCFSIVTRGLIKTYLPQAMWRPMIISFTVILAIYLIQFV